MRKLKSIPWWIYLAIGKIAYITILAIHNPDACLSVDAKGYLQLANNLWEHQTFSRNIFPPLLFDTLRTPGYPLFIIFSGGLITPWLTIIVQQCIHVLGAYWLSLLLTKYVSNKKTCVLFAILFAFDIPTIIFSSYLLADGLFQVLLIGCFYFLIGNKRYWISAFLLISACYVKPAGLYFIPIWSIFLLYSHWHVQSFILIICCISILGTWNYRNYQHHKRFIFSTAGEFNWCSWHGANIIAQQKNIPIGQAQHIWWDSLATNYQSNPEKTPVAYSSYISKQTTKLISNNPDLFAKQTIYNIAILWVKPTRSHIDKQWLIKTTKSNSSWLGKLQATSWLGLLLVTLQLLNHIILYPVAIFGWIALFKKEKYTAIFIGLSLAYFSCMILPPTTYARLRLPIIPLIYFLAAIGLPTFITLLKNNKWLTQKA